MLVQKTEADLILSRYPNAAAGNVPGLAPVVSNYRYALLEFTGPVGDSAADEPVAAP